MKYNLYVDDVPYVGDGIVCTNNKFVGKERRCHT